MHMRTKKWARPELAACETFIDRPEDLRGRWHGVFPVARPVHMELGCGKGVSTAQMVHANPDVNYLALDISADVLGDARRNLVKECGAEPDNCVLVKADIGYLSQFMAPEDRVERIYISFCNPWPRPKHHKRRLTHPRQLCQYRELLPVGGEIWFKTDDAPLFEDSLRYFAAAGFETVYRTDDLHASGFSPNFVTEHEARFSAEGIPIRFGIFRLADPGTGMDGMRLRGYKEQHLPEGLQRKVEYIRK